MAALQVLIVDDEPGIRSGIRRILTNYSVDFPFVEEEFTCDLIEAGSGEEAISIIDSRPIDLILLDNKLPGMDGIEVLEYINKKHYDASVMMITSYASLDLAIKATNNGAYNFVPKPFTPQELKSAMETIIKHLYLKRMTRQLNQEGKQIRFQFLSVLSHELKSPINAVEGYLRIMQEGQVGTNLEDYMTMIDRSLERIKGMRTLIIDLLDLTKLESGRKNRELHDIDLTEAARIARDTFLPMAIQKNVTMFLDSNPEKVSFKGDTEDMDIIFNNLISNAVKYNRDNGEVRIFIKSNEKDVLIEVSDTGIGMSEEETAKLFQEFVRIKNSKTKNITGSGLGLSILKKIVEEVYHGEIKVKSVPDQGTTFSISLPRLNAPVLNQ
jgi:signal transduction histidine kinase